MSAFVEIPVPHNFETYDERSRVSYFRQALGSVGKLGELASALDLDCDPPNRRARLEDVNIERVTMHADEIRIDYSVSLSEFQACKDVHGFDTFHRSITGVQSGNAWHFRKHTTLAERSTHDEL